MNDYDRAVDEYKRKQEDRLSHAIRRGAIEANLAIVESDDVFNTAKALIKHAEELCLEDRELPFRDALHAAAEAAKIVLSCVSLTAR